MNEYVTITIHKSSRSTIIGKTILLLIFGCVVGYFVALDRIEKFDQGQQLTMEQYTAEFEQHKAKLTKKPIPVWAATSVCFGFALFFFGIYELLGRLLGLAVGKILTRRENVSNSS
ncbi:MAG: hypothetical protein QGG64_08060 [Candidatus Latescibacteria bacterium]|nr:hypothetical protein [Candidatus Latescibacterota bacterium]